MAKGTLVTIAQNKFFYLLISLLLLFLIHPLLEGVIVFRFLLQIFFSVVLISALYAVSQKKVVLIVGLILLLPTLVGGWSLYFIASPALDLTGRSFGALFFAFTATTLVSKVFKEDEVTADTIAGAICVYLLIGLTWAFLYSVMEFLHPGSFSIDKFLPQDSSLQPEQQTTLFFYYSFVTLTTLGYGDIIPLTTPARAISFVEAIIGQIYVAVLIARIVGLHIVHSGRNNSR